MGIFSGVKEGGKCLYEGDSYTGGGRNIFSELVRGVSFFCIGQQEWADFFAVCKRGAAERIAQAPPTSKK